MGSKVSYLRLIPSGELQGRADSAWKMLDPCNLCPRQCESSRVSNQLGVCRIGENAVVASFNPHFGEEPELVGYQGSGTVFFSGCNLGCIFCQNYDISHLRSGQEVTAGQLASIFLAIQRMGCHNLNWVSPTHVLPQILSALVVAAENGLSLPIVYNTGGYDSLQSLKLLEGIIDIYMPDLKSLDKEFCTLYLNAPDYPEVAQAAILEMARQVGDFEQDDRQIARKGVLVRHLVMPEREEDSYRVMDFLSREVPARIHVNVMEQYRPMYRSHEYPELDHRTSRETFFRVRQYARRSGLELCR